MSQVDVLIAEHCPEGVQHASLGEIGTIFGGLTGKSKADFSNGDARFVSYVNIFNNLAVDTTAPDFVTILPGERQRALSKGDVLLTGSSETADEVAMSSVITVDLDEPVYLNSFSVGYRFNEPDAFDPDFTKHLFRSASVRKQLVKTASGVTRFNVSKARLAEVKIPILPLAVQRTIASMLDTMDGLRVELEAELKLRTRQYSNYAHVLLESGADVPRVRLGDIATIVRGASPRPIQSFFCSAEEGVPWIKIGDVPAAGKYITSTGQFVTPAGAAKSRRVQPGDFVLSNSMSFGRPYISKIDGYIHDGWLAISGFEESFVPDYLYYLLRSSPVQAEFARRAGSGTVKNLNADIVKSVSVPLPTRERQEHVVELLDRFDLLVNDRSDGIPAELDARLKQYEYYRDRLVSFDEVVS